MSENAPRILVAEDDMLNQRVIEMQLKRLGCIVEIANDGAEATSLYRQGTFNLILMDNEMPRMTGPEASIAIRHYEQQNKLSAVPIYAMTGHFEKEDRERCTNAGMDGFIVKPLSLEKLKDVLEQIEKR